MSKTLELYLRAKRDIGVQETPGDANTPNIMEYYKEAGHSWVRSELTPWCSAAMCFWCSQVGIPHPGTLRAKSWLTYQTDCVAVGGPNVELKELDDLQLGDIVILTRGPRNGKKGHIAIFEGRRDGFLYLYGGNQNNKVCTKKYRESRFILGLRPEGLVDG